MGLIAAEVLSVLMRWMHIASVTLFVGGAAYARLIVRPALEGLDADDRSVLVQRFKAGFRPLAFAAMAGILGSGLFNFFARPGHTLFYHVLFGIKMLLVAHVFASATLMVRSGPAEDKYFRRASGVLVSGVVIILISAFLRRIF